LYRYTADEFYVFLHPEESGVNAKLVQHLLNQDVRDHDKVGRGCRRAFSSDLRRFVACLRHDLFVPKPKKHVETFKAASQTYCVCVLCIWDAMPRTATGS
jgi:hypothetical protein